MPSKVILATLSLLIGAIAGFAQNTVYPITEFGATPDALATVL